MNQTKKSLFDYSRLMEELRCSFELGIKHVEENIKCWEANPNDPNPNIILLNKMIKEGLWEMRVITVSDPDAYNHLISTGFLKMEPSTPEEIARYREKQFQHMTGKSDL